MAVYSMRGLWPLYMYVFFKHINGPFLDLPMGQEEKGAI